MADGTLIFDTKLDISEFQKALKNLRAQVKNTTDAAVKLDVEVDESKARKAAKKVQDAAESADPTVEIGAEADQSDINAAVNKVEGAAENADPKVDVKTEVDTSGVQEDAEDVGEEVKEGLDKYSGLFDDEGNLKIKVELDASALKDDTRKVVSEVEKQSSGVGTIVKGALGANLIQEAGEKLIDFAKDSVMAASDLQEVQNVVDVTFGDAADKINDFAKDGAKAFGLTELQTKKYTGTLGALFKSMGMGQDEVTDMSVAMAGLVGDMASFYNLDYDEAFEKLRSGISGETEPLKQLGINLSVANLEAYALSQGIKTAYEEMSEAEKATLRYNYIMSVTADAQGDFARTSDGFANQLRTFQNNIDTLKTNIGSKLLPVLSTALTAINGLFDGSAGIGGKTQLQTEIDAAAESLKSVTTEIDDLKAQYASTKIQIIMDYQRSQALIDDYEKLSNLETLTDADLANMKSIVDELTRMYPKLEDYVGENSLFKIEAEEVRKLTQEYKALAEQTAYMQMVQGVYTQSKKAEFEMNLLADKSLEAETQVQALKQQYDMLKGLYDALNYDTDWRTGWETNLIGGNIDISAVQKATDTVKAYIEALGGIDDKALSNLTEAGVNLEAVYEILEGSKSTEDLNTEEIASLFSVLDELALSDSLPDTLSETSAALTDAQTAADAAAQALVDGLGILQDAQSELQSALSAYQAMTGDTSSEIVQMINEQLKDGGVTIATSAGEINAEMIEKLSDSKGVRAAMGVLLGEVDQAILSHDYPDIVVNVRYDDPGYKGSGGSYGSTSIGSSGWSLPGRAFATGIDYVPYNEYPALLHRGESVLRADDAAAWRAIQKSGGDTRALDTVAGALEDIASQPINVFIDSAKVAEAVREPISYAQNGASRSRALGVGK